MHDLLRQLRAADDAGLYYMVLWGTLSLPDICGGLETPCERHGVRYRRWYEQNVRPTFPILTAEECWKYRCSILHDANSESADTSNHRNIVFIEPKPGIGRSILNMPNKAKTEGVIGAYEIALGNGHPSVATANRILLHNDNGETVLPIDLQLFYVEVSCAVARWLERVTDAAIRSRIDDMIRRRDGSDFGIDDAIIG